MTNTPHVWLNRQPRSGASAGPVAKAAESNRRFHILIDCAERGESFEDACRQADLTSRGAKKLLYRRLGSAVYPPK